MITPEEQKPKIWNMRGDKTDLFTNTTFFQCWTSSREAV